MRGARLPPRRDALLQAGLDVGRPASGPGRSSARYPCHRARAARLGSRATARGLRRTTAQDADACSTAPEGHRGASAYCAVVCRLVVVTQLRRSRDVVGANLSCLSARSRRSARSASTPRRLCADALEELIEVTLPPLTRHHALEVVRLECVATERRARHPPAPSTRTAGTYARGVVARHPQGGSLTCTGTARRPKALDHALQLAGLVVPRPGDDRGGRARAACSTATAAPSSRRTRAPTTSARAQELIDDTRTRLVLNVNEELACEALAYRLEETLAG